MASVSVILPVFNAADSIQAAVESILGQSHRDFELIVVDDGSTDATRDVLASFRDSRMRVETVVHGGVVSASNRGLQLAQSPLVARMDADDVAHPQRLEEQLAYLEGHALDVVGSQVAIKDREGNSVPSLERYEEWINQETLTSDAILALRFVEFPLVNPTLLAKREYFELGFRDGDFPEDWDLMLRGAAGGMRFGKVPRVLLTWYDHDSRATRTNERYSAEAFQSCRRRHFEQGPLAGIERVDLWGWGPTGKDWFRWLRSTGREVRVGYDVSSRKVGRKIHGVPIRSPEQLLDPDGTPLIIAVGRREARGLIRPHLVRRGYLSGRDAWFVA